jgi:hypothetical protein
MTGIAHGIESGAATQLRTRLMIVGAGAGVLLLTLPLKWYTASSPYGTVDATGWEALTIGRLVLVAVVVAAAAFAFEGLAGRLTQRGITPRDAAHVLTVLAGLGAAWILVRAAIPPHFAEIRMSDFPGAPIDNEFGIGSSQDQAATDSISYTRTAAIFLAAGASCVLVGAAYLIATDEPGGFDPQRAMRLAAAARHGWPGLRAETAETAAAPPPVPRRDNAAQPSCASCGTILLSGDRFCTRCGTAREAT